MSMCIYRVTTWGLFPGIKGSEREANNCHLVQWYRVSEEMPPRVFFINTFSWRGGVLQKLIFV
jgi:hypothetical protein